MPATSIVQNFKPIFINGSPYVYASAGAAESITLPLSTSFFVLSNEGTPAVGTEGEEGYVAAANGDLTVSLPDGDILGTFASFQLTIADTNNDIIINFTGLNGDSDSLTVDNTTGLVFPVIASLVWNGDAWAVISAPNIEPTLG